jgi:hypothetical protein
MVQEVLEAFLYQNRHLELAKKTEIVQQLLEVVQ